MDAASGELVPVVDEGDRVLRTVTRAEMRARKLRHRAVFVAVVHPDGRLLIHQRSFTKDLWPGQWDMAVGGVVTAGESYAEAARRELAEEVGIVGVEPEPLGAGAYADADVSLLGRCYRVESAGPFRFSDGEVLRTEWVAVEDLARLVAQRRFLPDSLALLLPLLTGPDRSG